MSIKFWNKQVEPDVFVRFDVPCPIATSIPVWLCSANGRPITGGFIITLRGDMCGGIPDAVAEAAGLELDADGKITRDSLAQICAEMAKRIQGD